MSDKFLNNDSSCSDTDSSLLRAHKKFGVGDLSRYVPATSTSDLAMPSFPPESDKEYWGTPEGMKKLSEQALSSDDFDALIQFLGDDQD